MKNDVEETTPEINSKVQDSVLQSQHDNKSNQFFKVLSKYGLIFVLFFVIAAFGIMKPTVFLTIANLKTTIALAAPLLVLAVGLTVPLSMGEFDLSIGNSAQISGAVIISLVSLYGFNWGLAVLIESLIAIAVGGLIGFIIVRSDVNAFIVTLGAGTVMAGIEFGITHGSTIFKDIPKSYTAIGSSEFLGIPICFLIGISFAILIWIFMELTVSGRRMRAIGGNAEAARLSGVRVNQLRVVGFIISALAAVVVGVLFTSASSAYYPNAETAQLLPAYAACFLGSTVFRANLFEVPGTIIGVAFLATIQDGLIMVGAASWLSQVVQGSVLIIAVVGSRVAAKKLI